MELNEEQNKAVFSNERFLFLLAGAGSGKTRVIVERIKRLVLEGTDPTRILALTFSRKAAAEMRHRIKIDGVPVHTFHSYCLNRLEHIKQQQIKVQNGKNPIFKKADLLNIAKYKTSVYRTTKPFSFQRYQGWLLAEEAKDYEDLLLDFYRFQKKGIIKNSYDHVLIDEFQDTNLIQYEIVKKLIGKTTSVFAVGDPDQAIYRFRGAHAGVILDYLADLHAKVLPLTVNYRSNTSIIEAANRLIMRNQGKLRKALVADNPARREVVHVSFEQDEAEAAYVSAFVSARIKHRIQPVEIAILYRNHHRSYELQQAFLEQDIAFQEFEDDGVAFKQGVQFMTIHKAKGLEFDVVIILGLEEGWFPSKRQNRLSEQEEERRLMFVAMTRARHELLLTSIQKDVQGRALRPSVFIHESGVKTIKKMSINGII
ncbi:MAG: ATP-dependent helicase [Acholeplasmataceae bacterium]|nr:MAG: ATP-dependent helicase [Acholeplasmataceae bacterium]